MSEKATVILIPAPLDDEATDVLPSGTADAIRQCQVFYVENERTTRRYFKKLWKEMVIDDYEWVVIHKAEPTVIGKLREHLKKGLTIGIVSEAGCPGVADPGQLLVSIAHEQKAVVRPLVGPSSILLALMASGMNGQEFRFVGYLPIDNAERLRMIRELETESRKRNCTMLFIETPYRNNQLLEQLLKSCANTTRICVAADLTGKNETIQTLTVEQWRPIHMELHKRPVIFLLHA